MMRRLQSVNSRPQFSDHTSPSPKALPNLNLEGEAEDPTVVEESQHAIMPVVE
jgi:hypothetical protein